MGTITSGWYRGKAPRCEQRRVLDIAGNRDKISAGSVLHVHWSAHGERRTAALSFTSEGLRIEYGSDDEGRWHSANTTELAPWHMMPLHFGGSRRWLGCPGCGRRCRVLYGGVERIRCRLCLGLKYLSQLAQPGQRAMDRAHRIARRLDPLDGNALDGCPPRPLWMRWRTYRRLESELDYHCAVGLARIMGTLARAAR